MLEFGDLILVGFEVGTFLVLELIFEVSVLRFLLVEELLKEANFLVGQGFLLVKFRLFSLLLASDVLVLLLIGGDFSLSLLKLSTELLLLVG